MVHQKLIQHRKEKGLSQKEMATKIAMEQTTYSRKERGKSAITEEEWSRLAKVLEIPIEDLKEDQKAIFKNENCTFNDDSIAINYVNIILRPFF